MNLSYLDKIRKNSENVEFKKQFINIYNQNKDKTIKLINDINTFASLYLIVPEIEKYDLISKLNTEKKYIYDLVKKIIKKENIVENEENYKLLIWIVKTGYIDDGLCNEYDEILDISVSLLIDTYKEKSILPLVCEMIFNRHKKGYLIHDLAWAFFRSYDASCLKLIANNLKSQNLDDVKLACKLLNIKPAIDINNRQNLAEKYNKYLKWLKENDPFLYFTGESFNFSSNPTLCNIDLDRKYICKGTPSYAEEPYSPADEKELQCLAAFNNLKDDEKQKLSEYSYKLYNKNRKTWEKWISSPIDEQKNMGVLV